MKFKIITLFPEALEQYVATSILGRGQESGLINIEIVNLRQFATDKHATVDDTPYGGGAGMILKVEPIDKALDSIGFKLGTTNKKGVLLSARGSDFTQKKAQQYSQLDELVLVCGRYEGVDQRVADELLDEEISVGPYVLAGGELPALTVLEATARLVPGVLGNSESVNDESYSQGDNREYPQYTRPEEYRGWKVPEILLSGDHQKIDDWRKENSD